MFISKIIIYYIILYFIYKIIKAKFLKETYFCDKVINNEYSLIPYKHKKQSKITLQEVYDNFFKNKKVKLENNIDLTLFNNIKHNNENIKKDTLILNETKENIILEEYDNFLNYNFNSKKNHIYKIKFKLFINNCNNIKLIISDSNKRFIYDTNKENNDDIIEYGFILDNFFNSDEIISIYILFDKIECNRKILINSLLLEITEKSFKKEDSLIIFNINNKYIPLYTDVENILDFTEYSDNSKLFFF